MVKAPAGIYERVRAYSWVMTLVLLDPSNCAVLQFTYRMWYMKFVIHTYDYIVHVIFDDERK